MTTTLADIKTNLRNKIKKGTSEDANLYSYIKKAVEFVEKRANFTWMFHLNTVTVDPESDFPRTLRTANRSVRAIDYIKVTHSAGEQLADYVDIRQAQSMRRWGPVTSARQRDSDEYLGEFFFTQDQLIYFRDTPLTELTLEVGWWEYSDFANTDGVTHWLFQHSSELVEELALMYYARSTRDFDRANKILANCQPELDDLVAAEEDRKSEASEVVMQRDFASENMG